MKIAACNALAKIAKMPITDQVKEAYENINNNLNFGPDYIVPRPFDKRVAVEVSYEVAKAAINLGVARKEIYIEDYKEKLEKKFLSLS